MQMENLFYQLMEPSPGILKSQGQSGDDKNLLVFFFHYMSQINKSSFDSPYKPW